MKARDDAVMAPSSEERPSRLSGRPIKPVRDPERERQRLDPTGAEYLNLAKLSTYASIGVRKLRDYLADPLHPLPSLRPGGKILVKRSDFDVWIERFRHHAGADVNAIVEEVLRDVRRA